MAVGKIDVIRAINALSRENIKPSSSKVREFLGEGSLTTITKFIKEYTAETERELELERQRQVFRPEDVFGEAAKLMRLLQKDTKALKDRIAELENDNATLYARLEALEKDRN